MKGNTIWIWILITVFCGCQSRAKKNSAVTNEVWGKMNGKEVKLFTLTNKNGMIIKVTNYGAALTYVSVPDRNDTFGNVVIGFDSLNNYVNDFGQHGKTIGRFANRIGKAQFSLNGITYKLTPNNGPNTLHGGPNGFSNQVFEIDSTYSGIDSSIVSLHYSSADMEEGFPGDLTLFLNYVLTSDNEIRIEYRALTDKPTVVNFTNHSYFNLTGTKNLILDHCIRINADSIMTIGPDRLPTGSFSIVRGTIYDFMQRHKVREKLDPDSRGYDVTYKLRKNSNELGLAADVYDPISGRILEAFTTEPGMQLFTPPNAICLEMQHFPDSPNKPQFPSVVLNPGEIYKQLTIYKFSVIKP
jgi:aldose 1-epimerase